MDESMKGGGGERQKVGNTSPALVHLTNTHPTPTNRTRSLPQIAAFDVGGEDEEGAACEAVYPHKVCVRVLVC